MLRGASLRRVSTHLQAREGYSLENQAEQIAAYCERAGIDLVESVVVGGGVSGAADHRADLLRIRQLVEAKAIDCVVACNVERTARRAWVTLETIEYLRRHKIPLYFVQHPGADTKEGRLLVTVLAGIAEFDRESIIEKGSQGRAAKARAGLWPCGRSPYGLRLVTRAEATVLGEHPSGTLLAVEAEQAIGAELYARYAAGASLYQLVRWLWDEGHRNRDGKAWTVSGIHRLLINPANQGEARFGAVTVPCPAMVNAGLWEAVQQRLRLNAKLLAGRPSARYPLSGCLYCAHCATARGRRRLCGNTQSWRGRYFYRKYICPSSSGPTLPPCGLRLKADPVEAEVTRFLVRLMETDWLLEYARAEEQRRLAEGKGPAEELRAVERRLAAIDREEDLVLDRSLKGAPAGAVQRRFAQLREQRAALEIQRAALAAAVPARPLRLVAGAELLRARLRAAWTGDLTPLRPLLRAVLRVTCARDGSLRFAVEPPERPPG